MWLITVSTYIIGRVLGTSFINLSSFERMSTSGRKKKWEKGME